MSVGRSGVTFCRGFRRSCSRHLGRSAGTFCRGFSLIRAVEICRAFCRYLLSRFSLVALWMDVVCRAFCRYRLSRFSPIAFLTSVGRARVDERGEDTRSGSACPLKGLRNISPRLRVCVRTYTLPPVLLPSKERSTARGSRSRAKSSRFLGLDNVLVALHAY